MKRILSSSALLAACLGMAACGSSSGNSPSTNLTALTGTYVFQEQVYTYISPEDGVHAPPANMSAKKLHQVNGNIGGRGRSVQFRSNSSHAVPAQGSVNSNVFWGGVAGAIQFDGAGNVLAGEIDYNEPLYSGYFADTIASGSTYTINPDNTGTLTLYTVNSGDVFYFEFGLQGSTDGSPASGAQIVEGEENAFGSIEIGTGTMLQLASNVNQGTVNGNYVFGMQGQTCYGSPCPQANQGDLYTAGLLAANGTGTFGAGSQADVSDGFASGNLTLNGTYTAPDSNGRATASLTTTGGDVTDAGALPGGYVIYIANPSTFFLLSTDNNNTSSGLSPYLFGQAKLQSGSFSNSTLTGTYVLAESTEDLLNETESPDTYSDTYLALLASAGGSLVGTGDSNKAGTVATGVPYNYGTYNVDPTTGRVTSTGTTPAGAKAPVFWLQNSSFAYGVDQPNSMVQEPGLINLYQQASGSFSASSLNGTYALGTLPASTSLASLFTGVVASDGISALSGDIGVSSLNVSQINVPTANYTMSATGRATTTGPGNSLFGDAVIYTVSPDLALSIDLNNQDTAPSIQTLQQP